jgi:hypothetical protein
MKTEHEVRQRPPQAGGPRDTDRTTRHGRWHLLRHYLEMVAAMLVGMAVLGPVVDGVLGLAGVELPADRPELIALAMALDMSVGMVVWMRHRGHGWWSTLEMAGAMCAPAVVLLPPLWLGLVSGDSLLVVQHVAMLPVMALVMLRRRSEYGG